MVTEASDGIGLQVTRGLARPSQQRHNRKQLRQHCAGSQTRGEVPPAPARVSWVTAELRSLRFPSPNSRLCAAVAGALANRNPSRSPALGYVHRSRLRCSLRSGAACMPPGAGSGTTVGLGLLLGDLLQVCMPVRLILVQGPGDSRRMLLSYLARPRAARPRPWRPGPLRPWPVTRSGRVAHAAERSDARGSPDKSHDDCPLAPDLHNPPIGACSIAAYSLPGDQESPALSVPGQPEALVLPGTCPDPGVSACRRHTPCAGTAVSCSM